METLKQPKKLHCQIHFFHKNAKKKNERENEPQHSSKGVLCSWAAPEAHRTGHLLFLDLAGTLPPGPSPWLLSASTCKHCPMPANKISTCQKVWHRASVPSVILNVSRTRYTRNENTSIDTSVSSKVNESGLGDGRSRAENQLEGIRVGLSPGEMGRGASGYL